MSKTQMKATEDLSKLNERELVAEAFYCYGAFNAQCITEEEWSNQLDKIASFLGWNPTKSNLEEWYNNWNSQQG